MLVPKALYIYDFLSFRHGNYYSDNVTQQTKSSKKKI